MTSTPDPCNLTPFDSFRQLIHDRFEKVAKRADALYTTDVDPDALWLAYLDGLPADIHRTDSRWMSERQSHTCSACRHFIQRYGGLVVIEDGQSNSAIWPAWPRSAATVPTPYLTSVRAMRQTVDRARVTGVFLSSESTLGTPETGIWTHLHVAVPDKHKLLTGAKARQRVAELREDFRTISRALVDFDISVVEQAVAILESDVIYRGEKVLGPARWLLDLKKARDGKDHDTRRNLTWAAIATAPPGFAHPRSTMIGTLLEDIAGGLGFEHAARRFRAKMNPLQYQRPQALPSAGNVAQAERVVAELGLGGAFERRFCRLDEVDAIWRTAENLPTDPVKPEEGFSDVPTKTPLRGPRKRQAPPMELPPTVMTWTRFRSEVLPSATRVEFYAPSTLHLNYTALVTASRPDAQPILQWDSESRRNPVSWYVWPRGSTSADFSLEPGYRDVPAITLKPPAWYGGEGRHEHQGQGVIFLVDGACDTRKSGGVALFPECLRRELHAVRKTVETYSRHATLGDAGGPAAAGIMLNKGDEWAGARFRVTSRSGRAEYRLDRWE